MRIDAWLLLDRYRPGELVFNAVLQGTSYGGSSSTAFAPGSTPTVGVSHLPWRAAIRLPEAALMEEGDVPRNVEKGGAALLALSP